VARSREGKGGGGRRGHVRVEAGEGGEGWGRWHSSQQCRAADSGLRPADAGGVARPRRTADRTGEGADWWATATVPGGCAV
jgi:hypothetical protein